MIGIRRPPASAVSALALVVGIAAAEFCQLPAAVLIASGWLIAFAVFTLLRAQRRTAVVICLFVGGTVVGAMRWTMLSQEEQSLPLRQLAQSGERTVELTVSIVSVPAESERPKSRLSGRVFGAQWKTRFVAHCASIALDGRQQAVSGLCRVFVDGQTADRVKRGDRISMTCRISWPDSPGNPGEFDFEAFLRRRGTSVLCYVSHPQAIRILEAAGPTHPGYWLSQMRTSAHAILQDCVDAENRGIAVALLLGDRNELGQETEETFISSGTMHLLAISGLHIGILCLLLLRVFHWLLIPWTRSLVITVAVCVIYAFVTDMRPSVVRATLFVFLFTAAQIWLRNVNTLAVTGLTACVMLIWQPHLVFDTGAWLSFLSVMALGHATQIQPPRSSGIAASLVRPVALTAADRTGELWIHVRRWLWSRYRPMLWILAATTPLIASEFHVASPVSLLVNVLLIPVTAVTLGLGFAALVFGWLLPVLPNLPGLAFSGMLSGLNRTVRLAADVGIGHLYVPDLPIWFLPLFYLLLVTIVTCRQRHHRQMIWLAVMAATSVVLVRTSTSPVRDSVHCTILDVRHGSAAVVECPGGDVLLVDAGAMNRGDRAGDVVCHHLWNRGFRMVNSIIVSHADVDHFNALAGVLAKFPAGELLVSQHFIHNESEAVTELLTLARRHQVAVRIVADGETVQRNGVGLRMFQAEPDHLALAESDNERSLVVELRCGGRTICLPGDLEGGALDNVLPRLSPAEVLISPHHGSLNANVPAVADHLQPKHVIVSARDDANRPALKRVYGNAELHFTSEEGAVTVELWPDGDWHVTPFRKRD